MRRSQQAPDGQDRTREPPLRLLLAEGPDDANVLWHLVRYHGLSGDVDIESGDGIDRVLSSVPIRLLLN